MRRWLFVFLLAVMPVQLVWASIAPYCAHETSSAAKKHFGHHEHQHQTDSSATSEPDHPGEEGPAAYHADCESCHLGCSLVLAAPTTAVGVLPHSDIPMVRPASYTSHVPSGPERPDRVELPAAARFGGGVEFVC